MQIKSQFSIHLKCIRLVGLINSNSPRMVTFFAIFYPTALIFSLLSMLLFIIKNRNDIISSADALGPFTTGIISLSKFLSFHFFRSDFFKIIDSLDSMADKSKFSNQFHVEVFEFLNIRILILFICLYFKIR